MDEIEKKFTKEAKELFVGRTITSVRYMTKEEQEEMGWFYRPIVLHLDDGTLVFPVQDEEGNDGGVIFTNSETIPKLR